MRHAICHDPAASAPRHQRGQDEPKTLLLLAALIPADALGAAALPTPVRGVKPDLKPVGAATLHWFGLHVYDIALYAQEGYTANSTAVLSIRHNISIKHQRLWDTTLKEWVRLGKGESVQREQWIR